MRRTLLLIGMLSKKIGKSPIATDQIGNDQAHVLPLTVPFVCVGNVCRSPLAERLLRHRLDERLGSASDLVHVESAGIRAMTGRPMDAMAAQELSRLGPMADEFTARRSLSRSPAERTWC